MSRQIYLLRNRFQRISLISSRIYLWIYTLFLATYGNCGFGLLHLHRHPFLILLKENKPVQSNNKIYQFYSKTCSLNRQINYIVLSISPKQTSNYNTHWWHLVLWNGINKSCSCQKMINFSPAQFVRNDWKIERFPSWIRILRWFTVTGDWLRVLWWPGLTSGKLSNHVYSNF